MPAAETRHQPKSDLTTKQYYVAYGAVLIVFDTATGTPIASAHRGDDGWWEGTDIAGKSRMLLPRPDAPIAEADIAERLTRTP